MGSFGFLPVTLSPFFAKGRGCLLGLHVLHS